MDVGATSASRRILLVDDVELNRVLTEAVLEGATYMVDSVTDGTAALAALNDNEYDLVLMDLEMPGMSGHEAAAAIRLRDDRAIRLVALSSRGGEADLDRSRQLGMAAHICRPIAPHILLREIERVFCGPAKADRPDPWQRALYDDWVKRLGAGRMSGVLTDLLGQFRGLLQLLETEDGHSDEIHRRSHDVASTGGMLGFPDVTRTCRTILEDDSPVARATLLHALTAAAARLDLHFATSDVGAMAQA